jgi:hypothetical protein
MKKRAAQVTVKITRKYPVKLTVTGCSTATTKTYVVCPKPSKAISNPVGTCDFREIGRFESGPS